MSSQCGYIIFCQNAIDDQIFIESCCEMKVDLSCTILTDIDIKGGTQCTISQ